MIALGMARADTHADAHAQAPARFHATLAAAAATSSTLPFAAAAARGARLYPRRALQRDGHVTGHRLQVERRADEIAQGHHQLGRVDRAAGGEVARRLPGQAALLGRAEQQDVGQRRLDGIAGAARAVGTGRFAGSDASPDACARRRRSRRWVGSTVSSPVNEPPSVL